MKAKNSVSKHNNNTVKTQLHSVDLISMGLHELSFEEKKHALGGMHIHYQTIVTIALAAAGMAYGCYLGEAETGYVRKLIKGYVSPHLFTKNIAAYGKDMVNEYTNVCKAGSVNPNPTGFYQYVIEKEGAHPFKDYLKEKLLKANNNMQLLADSLARSSGEGYQVSTLYGDLQDFEKGSVVVGPALAEAFDAYLTLNATKYQMIGRAIATIGGALAGAGISLSLPEIAKRIRRALWGKVEINRNKVEASKNNFSRST